MKTIVESTVVLKAGGSGIQLFSGPQWGPYSETALLEVQAMPVGVLGIGQYVADPNFFQKSQVLVDADDMMLTDASVAFPFSRNSLQITPRGSRMQIHARSCRVLAWAAAGLPAGQVQVQLRIIAHAQPLSLPPPINLQILDAVAGTFEFPTFSTEYRVSGGSPISTYQLIGPDGTVLFTLPSGSGNWTPLPYLATRISPGDVDQVVEVR